MPGAARKRAHAEREAHRGGRPSDKSTAVSTAGTPSAAGLVVGDAQEPASETGTRMDGPTSSADAASVPQAGGELRPVFHDPAREVPLNRNIDFSGNIYGLFSQYDVPFKCMARPGFNTSGKAISLGVNSYAVEKFPDKPVYQYDILIGSGVEKRGLIKAVWDSKTVQTVIGPGWVFDGNRLGWALKDIGPKQFTVDLDVEKGITPREGRNNRHKVVMRVTNKVNMAALSAWLEGKMEFDNVVLQAIDFLDHLMRVSPSKTMIPIKRSFFHQKMVERTDVGGGVEALKGVYQSIRAVQGTPARLVVNVDVSNCCFWGVKPMWALVQQICGYTSAVDIGNQVQKVQKVFNGPFEDTISMIKMRKMKKLQFRVMYRNASDVQQAKTFTVANISYKNARTHTFEYKDHETGRVTPDMSVFDYFKKKYNVTLSYPTLPLVETMKKGVVFPMEVCYVNPGQRYPYKLDEYQTANMIKFAVTRPDKRKAGIEGGLRLLNWQEDRYLQNFGVKIAPQMLRTQARLLNPPNVQFGRGQVKPGFSGRWRLDGQVFLTPNKNDLYSWGVCIINEIGRDKIGIAEAQTFIKQFINIYKGHGGRVPNTSPPVVMGIPNESGKSVEHIFNKTGNDTNKRPQLLIFMLGGKDSFQYLRIKKSADCRFGTVSQCMQNAHVVKCQAQYMSNVLMKVNAKLGGTTARVAGKTPTGHFKVPTMVIGADVSHASPGSLQPSMAAVTCSMDKLGIRYAAACESNGRRVEIITTYNMENMLTPIFREWMTTIGAGMFPHHVMYFRDGVSSGQFQHVLQQEIRDLKGIFKKLDTSSGGQNAEKVKFTVVIASKRHHIRFFPEGGQSQGEDKNKNPCPGVLVERDVTHPFEYDFYLNSHSAIQGTARPTHYHVLMDEMKMSPTDLQNLIYEHCYQYIRSTTPVSLFPAVYYAHLASNRARSHENLPASSGPHKANEEAQRQALLKLRDLALMEGKKLSKSNEEKLGRFNDEIETPLLLKMENKNGIWWEMWYI